VKKKEPKIHPKGYDFSEYLKCFEDYNAAVKKYGAGKIQLVISTHWCSEGYWIEPRGNEINKETDYVYTGSQVDRLFKRVSKGIEKAKAAKKEPGLIL